MAGEQAGVVYASDINTGVYALRFRPSSSAASLSLGAGALAVGVLAQCARSGLRSAGRLLKD